VESTLMLSIDKKENIHKRMLFSHKRMISWMIQDGG
jgi:hypothetical protein